MNTHGAILDKLERLEVGPYKVILGRNHANKKKKKSIFLPKCLYVGLLQATLDNLVLNLECSLRYQNISKSSKLSKKVVFVLIADV